MRIPDSYQIPNLYTSAPFVPKRIQEKLISSSNCRPIGRTTRSINAKATSHPEPLADDFIIRADPLKQDPIQPSALAWSGKSFPKSLMLVTLPKWSTTTVELSSSVWSWTDALLAPGKYSGPCSIDSQPSCPNLRRIFATTLSSGKAPKIFPESPDLSALRLSPSNQQCPGGT